MERDFVVDIVKNAVREWVLVGCGVYLGEAPRVVAETPKMTATALTIAVGAGLYEQAEPNTPK